MVQPIPKVGRVLYEPTAVVSKFSLRGTGVAKNGAVKTTAWDAAAMVAKASTANFFILLTSEFGIKPWSEIGQGMFHADAPANLKIQIELLGWGVAGP